MEGRGFSDKRERENSKYEHQNLVKIIRNIHEDLRRNFKNNGDEDSVWDDHVRDEERLTEYSQAMYKLATTVWTRNNPTTRIDWCHRICTEYFTTREAESSNIKRLRSFVVPDGDKVLLLDVGSCYGPFRRWDRYLAVSVDLCPATEAVLKCDFLRLRLNPPNSANPENLTSPVEFLPASTFHAVVFSLVLEYLPSSRQRWTFCLKAHRLLVHRGLLIIVTPDSKHSGYNVAMIKSWKCELQKIGFARYKYEKETHLHCMAFVKDREEDLDGHGGDGLFIPQDFRDYPSPDSDKKPFFEREQRENDILMRDFAELPWEM